MEIFIDTTNVIDVLHSKKRRLTKKEINLFKNKLQTKTPFKVQLEEKLMLCKAFERKYCNYLKL